MIETAATNPKVAARVKLAIDRDVKWHAKNLEASETRRREAVIEPTKGPVPVESLPPQSSKRKAEDQERGGRRKSPGQVGRRIQFV